MAALGARWRRPRVIPFGGSNAIGAAAYAWGYQELVEQLGGRRGTLFCVTSSGATHAGLEAGATALAGPAVVGVSIADPVAAVEPRVTELVREALRLVEVEGDFKVRVLDGQQGGGYGVPTKGGLTASRLLAQTEGILLDPAYIANGMAGVNHVDRRRRI